MTDRLSASSGEPVAAPPAGELRTDSAIRASELSYRRLFEAARDGILILDVDTGRITDVNPFLVELLGFSRAEMVGRTVAELSPFHDIESNQTMLERLQQHRYVRYEHLPLKTRDGRSVDVEFICNVYRAGDANVIQCNIRDITARKRAEREIQRLREELEHLNRDLERRVVERTSQLEAANEELDAFSHSVSHDLRAPLRHVSGFVELLQNDLGPAVSERNRGHLTTISKAAGRMGTLIDDLLALARVGRVPLRKSDVDVGALVKEALSELTPATNGRDIAWTLHPLPVVRADPGLLRLVLVNLLSNAVKFTSGRARARIEVGCSVAEGGETVFFVRDDGAGFDARHMDKLFGVFQRLHSQEQFEGTGVGLANVQRIVRRHGGRVWAEGAVDKGATFFFSLPP